MTDAFKENLESDLAFITKNNINFDARLMSAFEKELSNEKPEKIK